MNTFKTFRAGLMATALFAFFSSSSAFGQFQVLPASEPANPAKNAVAFTLSCTPGYCTVSGQSATPSIPRGYRLVITQVAMNIQNASPTAFFLNGVLQDTPSIYTFPADTQFQLHQGTRWGRAHNCVVTMDEFQVTGSYIGSGSGVVTLSGHLVKM